MGERGMDLVRAKVPVERLLRRQDFVRVKEQGWRVAGNGFAIQVLENTGENSLRVGFTATTKTIGNSVARNRARRRLKAAFDQCVRLNAAWSKGGLWLVLVARAGVGEMPWKTLVLEMEKALAKVEAGR